MREQVVGGHGDLADLGRASISEYAVHPTTVTAATDAAAAHAHDAVRDTADARGANTVGSPTSFRDTAMPTLRVTGVSPRSASPIVW